MKPKTLQEAIQYFADLDNCREFMIADRWPDGKIRCPQCGSEKVTYLEKARFYGATKSIWRRSSRSRWEPCSRTRRFRLEKWLPAVWMLVNCQEWREQLRDSPRSSASLKRAHGSCCTGFGLQCRADSFVKMGGPRLRSRSGRNLHRRQSARTCQGSEADCIRLETRAHGENRTERPLLCGFSTVSSEKSALPWFLTSSAKPCKPKVLKHVARTRNLH